MFMKLSLLICMLYALNGYSYLDNTSINSEEESPFALSVLSDPLPPANINCSNTDNSVSFVWDDIPGATGYDYNLVSVPATATVTETGVTSVDITGLDPGTLITIEVTAIGGTCANSVSVLSCGAGQCASDVDILASTMEFCQTDLPGAVNLTAEIDGALAIGEFSGVGIKFVNNNYIFDPAGIPAGSYFIRFNAVDPAGCVHMGVEEFVILPLSVLEKQL